MRMQTIMRSVLSGIKVARVRIFDSVSEAIRSMHSERPHVVLTDLAMQPTSGVELIKLMRRPDMDPLCYVPIIVVTSQASRSMLVQSMEAGAHHVLAKPVSPSIILKTLRWVSRDSRVIAREGDRYIITGIEEVVSQIAGTQTSAAGGSNSGDDGLKFHRVANNGESGENGGLKFQREEAGDGSGDDGLKYQRVDTVEESDSGLKFSRDQAAQGDDDLKFRKEAEVSSNTPMPERKPTPFAAARPKPDASKEAAPAKDKPEEDAAPQRKRRAFAALAR